MKKVISIIIVLSMIFMLVAFLPIFSSADSTYTQTLTSSDLVQMFNDGFLEIILTYGSGNSVSPSSVSPNYSSNDGLFYCDFISGPDVGTVNFYFSFNSDSIIVDSSVDIGFPSSLFGSNPSSSNFLNYPSYSEASSSGSSTLYFFSIPVSDSSSVVSQFRYSSAGFSGNHVYGVLIKPFSISVSDSGGGGSDSDSSAIISYLQNLPSEKQSDFDEIQSDLDSSISDLTDSSESAMDIFDNNESLKSDLGLDVEGSSVALSEFDSSLSGVTVSYNGDSYSADYGSNLVDFAEDYKTLLQHPLIYFMLFFIITIALASYIIYGRA